MKKNMLAPGRVIVIIMLLSVLSAFECSYAGSDDLRELGDVLQFALPAAAIGSTFVVGDPEGNMWDREGTRQSVKSIAATFGVVTAWKGLAGKLRPDAGSRTSFPSGHTSGAFSGASFIYTRYGKLWGIPAYGLAALTAYSRVNADAHFADDVTAGASVALMSNWFFVTPKPESGNVAVLPVILDKGAGIQLAMATDLTKEDISRSFAKQSSFARRKARYNFAFGPAFLYTNQITASTDAGTTFDLKDFEKTDDPTTTASIEVNAYFKKRHEFVFLWVPFESRDFGTFSSPVSFGGRIFPADTETRSAWRMYEIRGSWLYDLKPESRWGVKVGVGAVAQWVTMRLATSQGPQVRARVDDSSILPFLKGSLSYKLTPQWTAGLEADGTYLSQDYLLDLIASFSYQINDRWDFAVGYNNYNRKIETGELTNKVIYNMPYLAVAYSWL